MGNHQRQIRVTAKYRRALTLVELLVVGAIIVILVTLTLVGTRVAANSAKETKTRGTIQKLDVAIQQIFESYGDKYQIIKNRVDNICRDVEEADRQRVAAHLIRDWMRMEMPQSWAEVFDSTDNNAPNVPKAKLGPIPTPDPRDNTKNIIDVAESDVLECYYAEYVKYVEERGGDPATGPSRAALLFLMIQNLNPEALEAFHGSEVAAGDDGLSVFVDAWGKPIQFLRWAPAFHGSDVQPNVLTRVPYTDMQPDPVDWWQTNYLDEHSILREAMAKARAQYPDPADERENAIGWFLYPLIYSAGLDGKYGLIDENLDSPQVGTDEKILDPFAFPYGMPLGGHFDNIHNHQRYRSY